MRKAREVEKEMDRQRKEDKRERKKREKEMQAKVGIAVEGIIDGKIRVIKEKIEEERYTREV